MGPSKYFGDPKGSAKSVYRDLNKLRVKLALSKDSSLVKLPPSEAAIRQHILREIISYAIYELLKSTCMLRLFFDWYSI
jgi:hypothetical protein